MPRKAAGLLASQARHVVSLGDLVCGGFFLRLALSILGSNGVKVIPASLNISSDSIPLRCVLEPGFAFGSGWIRTTRTTPAWTISTAQRPTTRFWYRF